MSVGLQLLDRPISTKAQLSGVLLGQRIGEAREYVPTGEDVKDGFQVNLVILHM